MLIYVKSYEDTQAQEHEEEQEQVLRPHGLFLVSHFFLEFLVLRI